MYAGTAKIDVTPQRPVWMDGMIRAHRSEGVHDPIYARALVLSNDPAALDAFAVVTVDVCNFLTQDAAAARRAAAERTAIPYERILVTASHSHSGPATTGSLTPREAEYTQELLKKLVEVIDQARASLRPAWLGCASGEERTISHYRRLMADDGHVVMNWEPYPPERIVGPLGVADPEVGVLKVVPQSDPGSAIAVLFNHAGHPNVMSGDSYLISGDYPGLAECLLEERLGGVAMFVNGASGSVDIDGLRDRDWEGVRRTGTALADAVIAIVEGITPSMGATLRCGRLAYQIPARRLSEAEWEWAQEVLSRTGGAVAPLADGVGDDYLARLYREIHQTEDQPFEIEQLCFAVDDSAFVSFPGELYTEIGMRIKGASPFRRTYIVGQGNGRVSYVPTRKAIAEGGYSEGVRRLDDSAEEITFARSLELLQAVHDRPR